MGQPLLGKFIPGTHGAKSKRATTKLLAQIWTGNTTKRQRNKQDNNASGKRDSSPTMSRGSGLKEVVGWEEQCSEHQEIGVLAITPNSTTCEQIKEAVMNWAMSMSLGVTCHI